MQLAQLPQNAVKPAWRRLMDEYAAQGDPFHVVTRPYYSTGGFKFEVVPIVGGLKVIEVAGQLPRAILRAQKGQSIDFFSYALQDDVTGVGLPARPATVADTNISEKRETNDEDFAVMALSANARGIRIKQTLDTEGAALIGGVTVLEDAFQNGNIHVVDPGSHVVPPEVDSPLVLEDVLYQAIAKRTHLRQTWNRRDGDDITLLRNIPNGGGESLLKSNGEPSITNVFHLSTGYAWRHEGSGRDSKWGVRAKLEEDIVVIVTLPEALVADNEDFAASLESIHIDWQLYAHGNAFYRSSGNV